MMIVEIEIIIVCSVILYYFCQIHKSCIFPNEISYNIFYE